MVIEQEIFEFSDSVKIFPGPAAWYYVLVPKSQTKNFVKYFGWGLVPIEANLGLTTWQTSLLPKGDKNFFIALKASVRKQENIKLGDKVTLKYKMRGR